MVTLRVRAMVLGAGLLWCSGPLIARASPREVPYADITFRRPKAMQLIQEPKPGWSSTIRSVGVKWTVPACSPGALPQEVVVRSQEEYAALLRSSYTARYKQFQEACAQAPHVYRAVAGYTFEEFLDQCNVFPQIDFTQKTLLGKYVSGPPNYHLKLESRVYRDDRKKQLTYAVRVIGMTRYTDEMGRSGGQQQWITVPTVPFDYLVTFEVVAPDQETSR